MSNVISSLWNRTGSGLRLVVLATATALLAGSFWMLFVLLRPQYGVLFSDLATADAAAIVEHLKRDKVPYRLGAGERSIEVPMQRIHEVRLSLMSGNLPLSGGVGFEIFDKQGLGTSEQSQQVSYQRALQGELVRTISSLEHVKHVRVHLVLPQSSLFTRDRQQASAAVTVAMEPARSLQPNQIVGVQRLVAASVAGLEPGQVVITDQRGITLSAGDAGNAGAADARLQIKRDVEGYLGKKIADMLEGAFGGGQAIVTVDATLNFDNAKTTVQDLLPGNEATGDDGGRVVRRRQVIGAAGSGDAVRASTAEPDKLMRQPGSSVDVEYQYGRRVAEVVTAPGAVSRISIGVIVPGPLIEEKRQRITELVRMAAGFSEHRGDAISVQALDELTAATNLQPEPELPLPAATSQPQPVSAAPARQPLPAVSALQWPRPEQLALLTIPMTVAVLLSVAVLWRSRRRARLSEQARQNILEELEHALTAGKLSAARITL